MSELMPIVAAYATPTQGAGPMLVTLKAGLFEKHGLAVEAQDRGRALSVVAGLMAGELQFGNLAAPSMLRMVLNGEADVVFLALGINQQFLVSRPGLANRKDLAGARLGRSGDGAITDILMLFLQEQLGREGVAGTTLVPLAGTTESPVAALLHGEYDAVVLTPPTAIEAQRSGCHLVIDLADYGLNYSLGGNRGAPQLHCSAPERCPGVHHRLRRGAASLPHRSRVHGQCAAGVQWAERPFANRGTLRPDDARHAEDSVSAHRRVGDGPARHGARPSRGGQCRPRGLRR